VLLSWGFLQDLHMKRQHFSVAGRFISLDMRLSLTSYLLFWEAIQFSSNISSPLSLQKASDHVSEEEDEPSSICVALFKNGWIKHMVILSSMIISLPPTSMSCFL
jgi:hypothetical protein